MVTSTCGSESCWRLLPFSDLPAGRQLALSEALRSNVRRPALRWRRIAPRALVLGHGQPLADVDTSACRAAGVGIFRRATGGTAVLSDNDLLGLDLVLPAGHPLAEADVTRSYAWLGEALVRGLRALDVAAAVCPPAEARAQLASLPRADPLRRVCYATLSPFEVVASGRKLIGLAQARRRDGVLLQAGILLGWRPELLVPLLTLPPDVRASLVARLRARAIGLGELAPVLDVSTLAAALTEAIAGAAGAAIEPADWTAVERAAAARLEADAGALV